MDDLDKLQARLSAALDVLERKGAQTQSVSPHIETQITQLKTVAEEAENKNVVLETEISELREKSSKDAIEIDALTSSIRSLERGLGQLRAANEVLTEANAKLMETVDPDVIASAAQAEIAALKAARDAEAEHMRVLFDAVEPLLSENGNA